jgi:hypothetical protein
MRPWAAFATRADAWGGSANAWGGSAKALGLPSRKTYTQPSEGPLQSQAYVDGLEQWSCQCIVGYLTT